MKLSKPVSTAITTTSLTIFAFGVATTGAQAQILVSDEVSTEISEALGSADTDEGLVDALSQIESELRELGVTSFKPNEDDDPEIAELKEQRIQYIKSLRSRLSNLDGEQRTEFLSKIRDRRQDVRTKLTEIRQERKAELKERRELFKQRVEEKQAEVKEAREAAQGRAREAQENARERFKQNLEQRQDAAEERQKDAHEKFSDKVNRKIDRVEADPTAAQERNENLQEVKGAIDYQPQGFFEWVGYYIFGGNK